MARPGLSPRGAGLGLRPELSFDLLANRTSVDHLEVVAESCLAQPALLREACAFAEMWPVIPHGVKLSLGSADGIEVDRAVRLGQLARDLRAEVVTEHVAFVRGGSREIGHLTPLPRTRAAIAAVVRNVAEARRHLPDVPFLLENVAATFEHPDEQIDEGAFHAEIVEATGCDLMLDVSNLYANALNRGHDPLEVLLSYPLERVAMAHLAGGTHEGGFYFDTHAHPISEPIFSLLGQMLARTGPVPVVIERDDRYPPFDELSGEAARVRAQNREAPDVTRPPARAPSPFSCEEGALEALAGRQATLADLLTRTEAPGEADLGGYDPAGIARTRDVLRRKRVDDALPLLPRLYAYKSALEPIAYACVERNARAPRMAGIADAMRIARDAAASPALEGPARVDALVLAARFVLDGDEVRPRLSPFVGRERLASGASLWVFKGPGRGARVHIVERRP